MVATVLKLVPVVDFESVHCRCELLRKDETLIFDPGM